jgi:hypothetical protein
MSRRLALVIGNTEYQDPRLAGLATPSYDVTGLAEVLSDSGVGNFDNVTTFVNEMSANIRLEIESFFAEKKRDDLLLLYFSGHGVRDDRGYLYLALKDTRHNRLRATAIPASFITSEMDASRSRRQVLILDCCHSGAFAQGMKGTPGEAVGTASAFKGTGYGRVVLTASDATQYAWESEGSLVVGKALNSVFTRYLIEGMRTGVADRDADGWVGLDELYDYVYEHVVTSTETPGQTPHMWSFGQEGKIFIALNPHPVQPKPTELPLELRQLIESPIPSARQAAVRELGSLLSGSIPGLVLAAHEALQRLLEDDSRSVTTAAIQVLAQYAEAEQLKTEREADARAPVEPATQEVAIPPQSSVEMAHEEAERLAAPPQDTEPQAQDEREADRLADRAEAERIRQKQAEQPRLAQAGEEHAGPVVPEAMTRQRAGTREGFEQPQDTTPGTGTAPPGVPHGAEPELPAPVPSDALVFGVHLFLGAGMFLADNSASRKWIYPVALVLSLIRLTRFGFAPTPAGTPPTTGIYSLIYFGSFAIYVFGFIDSLYTLHLRRRYGNGWKDRSTRKT